MLPDSNLGAAAEQRAVDWLIAQGVHVVARNYRSRFGEIDVVAQDGPTLAFIEVRSRSRRDFGGALASVTPAKQKKLIATAGLYLASLRRPPPCRFDVIAFDQQGAPTWLKNAFGMDGF